LTLEGALSEGVTAKDVIMHVVAKLGVEGAAGAAIEFAGSLTRALPTEARFTLCNMAIEMNARTAIVAPDDETFRWLKGKPMAPKGVDWEGAVARWRLLRGDDDARFDDEVVVDCARLEPQISWGIDPSQTIGISQRVPDDTVKAGRKSRAHEYMGLIPGDPIAGIAVNRVFIGSCTNARLSDLESAAEVAHGRRVAPGVTAIVVPGSMSVRREAEARGLDVIFRAAGFEWHNAGCSMCAGGSGARANPGDRIVSTSNRNFEGRQGRDVRTHLASPAMAAAAAVTGSIVDVRRLLAGGA
jgi:3-isopropylmalate/(R)-2-methylmalate dehydratase large subunit